MFLLDKWLINHSAIGQNIPRASNQRKAGMIAVYSATAKKVDGPRSVEPFHVKVVAGKVA